MTKPAKWLETSPEFPVQTHRLQWEPAWPRPAESSAPAAWRPWLQEWLALSSSSTIQRTTVSSSSAAAAVKASVGGSRNGEGESHFLRRARRGSQERRWEQGRRRKEDFPDCTCVGWESVNSFCPSCNVSFPDFIFFWSVPSSVSPGFPLHHTHRNATLKPVHRQFAHQSDPAPLWAAELPTAGLIMLHASAECCVIVC